MLTEDMLWSPAPPNSQLILARPWRFAVQSFSFFFPPKIPLTTLFKKVWRIWEMKTYPKTKIMHSKEEEWNNSITHWVFFLFIHVTEFWRVPTLCTVPWEVLAMQRWVRHCALKAARVWQERETSWDSITFCCARGAGILTPSLEDLGQMPSPHLCGKGFSSELSDLSLQERKSL